MGGFRVRAVDECMVEAVRPRFLARKVSWVLGNSTAIDGEKTEATRNEE